MISESKVSTNEERKMGLHRFHLSIQNAKDEGLLYSRFLTDPNYPSALRVKFENIMFRLSAIKDSLEASFSDPIHVALDGSKTRGPVAVVEETSGGGGRLFVHGVLVRSVSSLEAPAIRRLAEMINEASQ